MPEDTTNGSRVVAALYALAADPGRWSELIDVLDQAPPGEAEATSLSQIAYGATQVATSVPAAAPTQPDTAEIGVLLVSRSGRLIAANAPAQAYVARFGFSGPPGGQTLSHLANFEVLAQARQRLAAAPGAPVIVKFLEDGADGESFAYVVEAGSLPAELAATLASPAQASVGALAILLPVASRGDAFWSGIRTSFGLTAAEVRLTARLGEGLTLREAADTLGLSVNTLRNQLTSIFDKLAIRRQSELIRSLNQLADLFDAVPPSAGADDGTVRTAIIASERDALFNAPPVRTMVLADGRALAWRGYGAEDGKPVLVCHGGLGASLMLRGTDEICRALGLRLVCPDRPGIGRSDPRPGHTLTGAAEDLVEFVDRLGIDQMQICTLTSGARFGLAVASLLGPRATRVLMLSPRLAAEQQANRSSTSPMVRFHDRIVGNLWVTDALFAVMRLRLTRPLIERITRASATAPGDAAYLKAHPALFDMLYEAMRESWLVSSRGSADEVRCLRLDAGPSLARLAAEVTIWHGEEDTYATPEAVAAYYRVTQERLRVAPGIGNYLIHRHWGEALRWLADGPASPIR